MKGVALLQAKAQVTLGASALLVGGAVAAFATIQAEQHIVRSFTYTPPIVPAAAIRGASGNEQGTPGRGHTSCPGLSEAQNLQTQDRLSTSCPDAAVVALCALHQDTFHDTTTAGGSMTARWISGSGEIDQLLILAQYLASHDRANAGGALSDSKVDSYQTNALPTCGATLLEQCLMTTIPSFQPGQENKPTTTPLRGEDPRWFSSRRSSSSLLHDGTRR